MLEGIVVGSLVALIFVLLGFYLGRSTVKATPEAVYQKVVRQKKRERKPVTTRHEDVDEPDPDYQDNVLKRFQEGP